MHRYEEIRAEMLRRIGEQIWLTDMVLPDENTLASEFGVARGTIRRAMDVLVEQGLLERRRKAGTRVAARHSHLSTLKIPIVRKEIIDQGRRYSYRLISDRRLLRGESSDPYFAGVEVLRIVCLHLSDDRPYQLEDRIISLHAVPEASQQDFSLISPNEWLLQRVPYSAVKTVLRAEICGADRSTHLDIEPEAPVFIIERQTRYDGEPVTSVRMSHPARTFTIVTESSDFTD